MDFCFAPKVITIATEPATPELPFLQRWGWLSPGIVGAAGKMSSSSPGDAAFTCGTSYEAFNNVADNTKRLIVVLNDNEWSIAKNVGAIANYLNKLVTNDAYSHLHEKAAKFVEMIGGRFAQQLVHKVEEGVKHLVLPSVIFEDLGLRYYGPIDGHDIPLADSDL